MHWIDEYCNRNGIIIVGDAVESLISNLRLNSEKINLIFVKGPVNYGVTFRPI